MEPANAPDPAPPEPAAGAPGGSAKGNGRNRIIRISILLAVATLLVFGRTIRYDFVNYDDQEYVVFNSHVQQGVTLRGVGWAFQTGITSNWHPLTWLSLMLDSEVFGRKAWGYHLTNVLLHAANTVLVFILLLRLTGACWRSAFVAGLFALHPLHVESVAWISERKDVLSGVFGLLALLMYARYAQSGSGRQRSGAGFFRSRDYWLAILFFGLGLMSKPMLVTLPFVMLLLDYWPLERVSSFGFRVSGFETPNAKPETRNLRQLIVEKLPFLAMSLASSIATLIAQKGAVQPLAHISLGIRSVNAVASCGRYLYKTFWPANLAIPYLHPGYGAFSVFCFSAALILAVTLMAVWLRKSFPYLVTGWFWFLGMLVPAIGLVQVGMQSMADRYTYLPLIGVFIMLAWMGGEIATRWRLPVIAVGGVAGLTLAACGLRTLDQAGYWRNSETLFRHTLAIFPANEIAHYNLGHYYSSQGRLDEAIASYRRAIQFKPDYDDALHNLGVVLAKKGDLEAAIAPIREAIRYRPDKADAYYNLGNVYALQRKLDDAANAFTEALRLKPDYPEAHNNYANVLLLQGRVNEAVAHYREALRLKPEHEGARRQLRALGVSP